NYYAHGPLARTELGDKKVQGLDYIYTLQGWLKSVNGENLKSPENDLGTDGLPGSAHHLFGKDAFGYSLQYFDNDYQAVNGDDATSNFKPLMFSRSPSVTHSTKNLYNGNIKEMVTALRQKREQVIRAQVNTYEYDQLNRIVGMQSTAVKENASGAINSKASYGAAYSYDNNGNLQTLTRTVYDKTNINSGIPIPMDNLEYTYKPNSNQLLTVQDYVRASEGTEILDYETDLKDQLIALGIAPAAFDPDNPDHQNYVYDLIGQLVQDKTEKLRIQWRVDGKVARVIKYTDPTFTTIEKQILFEYDGLGNRIAKIEQLYDAALAEFSPRRNVTYYARDAQANVLGVYKAKVRLTSTRKKVKLTLDEHHIYGSSRLGLEQNSLVVLKENENVTTSLAKAATTSAFTSRDDSNGYAIKLNPETTLRWQGTPVQTASKKEYKLTNIELNTFLTVSNLTDTNTSLIRLADYREHLNNRDNTILAKQRTDLALALIKEPSGTNYALQVVALFNKNHNNNVRKTFTTPYAFSPEVLANGIAIDFSYAPLSTSMLIDGVAYNTEALSLEAQTEKIASTGMSTTLSNSISTSSVAENTTVGLCYLEYGFQSKGLPHVEVFRFSKGQGLPESNTNKTMTVTVGENANLWTNSLCNIDTDNDSVLDRYEDVNGDGNLYNDDTDLDGIPNFMDADDDNDSVLTNYEVRNTDGDNNPLTGAVLDTDGDVLPNYLDPDDDNDGLLTKNENPDPNNDGNPTDAVNTDSSASDTLANYLDPTEGSYAVMSEIENVSLSRSTGDKRYELSNHLGNVLSVINDKKLPEFNTEDDISSGLLCFNADVLSYSDYYPFGMVTPKRNGSTGQYRYGFQGQEKDDELKGEGNSLNYKYRMHDPRVGRFFAVDPLAPKYPFYSPYQFSGNRLIDMVELEGLEPSKTPQTGDAEGKKEISVENGDGDYLSDVHNQKFVMKLEDVSLENFNKFKEQLSFDPGKIVNNYLAEYKLVDRDGSYGVTEGDHFDISIIGDSGSVVISEIKSEDYFLSVKVQTLEGHPDAGSNIFSVKYDPKLKQMTWETQNVSRTNVGLGGILSPYARAGQISQWRIVMGKVKDYIGNSHHVSEAYLDIKVAWYNDSKKELGEYSEPMRMHFQMNKIDDDE
ncbi:MAG: hypothetical protein HRT68_13670, partial [Flavobacteriaceae bacterium]|nr:hypothetical protein [Flavobacteriaceae bacterium]